MFIRFYKPFTKGYRNRSTITSFLASTKINKNIKFAFFKKKIYNNHKFLSNTNSIYITNMSKPLNGLSLLIKIFKASYTGAFLGFFESYDKSIFVKKLCYGWSFVDNNHEDILYTHFIKKNKIFNSGKYYLFMFKFDSKFCFLNCLYTSRKYATSPGTFCTIKNLENENYLNSLEYFFIKIPSGLVLIFDIFSMAISGRVSNLFNKYIFFSTFSKKFNIKKKWQSTRGIAKNPVDHPNGGRSKVKQPFKNPWGIIAKKGK